MIFLKGKYLYEPELLKNVDKEYKKAILGHTVKEQYEIYKKSYKGKYNNNETKEIFKRINHGYCSFCNNIITEFDRAMEVEHIKVKYKFPEEIFEWNNMLCSCHSCNTTRGKKIGLHELYLNPCEIEDIECYFVYSLTGKIAVNKNRTVAEQEKAKNMIELYKLDRDTLNNERYCMINQYFQDNTSCKKIPFQSMIKFFRRSGLNND